MDQTPAQLAADALTAVASIQDARERAIRGHELQVVLKDAPVVLRPLVDSAVAELRKDMSVAQVAELLGVSEQRVSQMATGRHRHKPTSIEDEERRADTPDVAGLVRRARTQNRAALDRMED
jgi:DNA-directed RNA polymerase specialized sigma subunit